MRRVLVFLVELVGELVQDDVMESGLESRTWDKVSDGVAR